MTAQAMISDDPIVIKIAIEETKPTLIGFCNFLVLKQRYNYITQHHMKPKHIKGLCNFIDCKISAN